MSQTISQILNEYSGFEKAFWASYSVNFTTLDFLLKKDLKQIMNPCYLHLICDMDQLDESIARITNDTKELTKLSKLQEYCTISPQFTEGAFHPKILLLASNNKLLFIVSSANATPSGILSNQDLIATFYYDNNTQENEGVVRSLFKYIRSFDGWGNEASEDLTVIEEEFNFLLDNISSNNLMTIPNDESLLIQMINSLPEDDVLQKINIFSPFFDDNYDAISKIEEQFKVPVNVFSPQKKFCTTRKESLSNQINFYHSDSLFKTNFHAKFYEFQYGEQSVVYWGSANCSFSGLLSPDRNYEFLIKCSMNKNDINALWGSLDNKKQSSVEYGVDANSSNKSNKQPEVYIKGISITEDGFFIQLDKPLCEQSKIKGIISNGDNVNLIMLSVNGNTINATCDEDGLVVLYVEKHEQRISNLIYINNPFALQSRISGIQNSPTVSHHNSINSIEVKQAFGYFKLERTKQTGNGSQSESSKNGFWRLPQFKSKTNLAKIINLESFVKQRVIKLKEKNDSENISSNENNEKTINREESLNIIKLINKETDTLLKNINTMVKNKSAGQIDRTRWLRGLDILTYYILSLLDETEKFPIEIENILFNVSRIASWIVQNLSDTNEICHESIELILTIQNMFLGLSVYQLLLKQRFSVSIDSYNREIDHVNMIKRALYFRYVTHHKFPEYKAISEHSQLTNEDILVKLPNHVLAIKTIEFLNCNRISKLKGLDDVQVNFRNTESLLFISKNNHLNFESILGDKTAYPLNAPLTYIDIIS